MSQATVRIPAPLRGFTGGAAEVVVEGRTAGEALRDLAARHPGLARRLLDDDGRLRSFVNVFVGDRNVEEIGGLEAPLAEGATIHVVPAVAGGGAASQRRLAELKREVPEVTPREAFALQRQGAVLVDVREPDEVAAGSPAGARRIVRGFLELRIEEQVPDLERPILVMCAGGARSLFAARDLQALGYRDVRSVARGFAGWKADGLPIEEPRVLSDGQRERYGRHILIPEVGEEGQIRLLDSKVLLVGAGGLGSPAAFYLAAAGVGTLGIVDDDVVDRSNLQRQILHADARVGTPKVDSARATLEALNPDVEIQTYRERLVPENVERIFDGYDLVLDGSDNFPTRYLVNDACVKLGLPNVHGSIFRFEGQVSVFWPGYPARRGPCYRCLFAEPPPPELAPSCAEAGVLGILPGVIGTLEAVEAVKILLDRGDPLVGRLLVYDALEQRFTELRINPNPDCPCCGDGATFEGYVLYDEACAATPG
ncbi:MAG: molybdopterin-synthase adenylyltransferase MoeB [Acidobacteria bacterium]|nr:MAG: molybdopterin-synthase adenylyltransferase MoeB [Acidobacteriota bacterium]